MSVVYSSIDNFPRFNCPIKMSRQLYNIHVFVPLLQWFGSCLFISVNTGTYVITHKTRFQTHGLHAFYAIKFGDFFSEFPRHFFQKSMTLLLKIYWVNYQHHLRDLSIEYCFETTTKTQIFFAKANSQEMMEHFVDGKSQFFMTQHD